MVKEEVAKGRIEEAKKRLLEVNEQINSHFRKEKEFNAAAYQLKLTCGTDVEKLNHAKDLEKLAINHIEIADRLKSNERYIATREHDELLEKSRLVRSNISNYKKTNERYQVEKKQLEQEYKRKIDVIERELENMTWQLEQAELILFELEGARK
jgi:hypothetical protein